MSAPGQPISGQAISDILEPFIGLGWLPSYSDGVPRPASALNAASQQAFAFAPAPERTKQIATTIFPDRIDRPFLPAHNQLAVTEVSPAPEKKLPYDWRQEFPDRLPNFTTLHPSQRGRMQVIVVPPPVLNSYPEIINRAIFQASEQQAFAFYPLPISAVTVPTQFPTSFPDIIFKQGIGVQEQPFFAFAPKPEEKIQLDWDPVYPDRATRTWLPTADQPFFASNLVPERTAPLATVVFPDRVERAFLTTANQFFVSEVIPKPEEKIQLDWEPSYPDRALRSVFLTAEYPFFATSPNPEEEVQLDWDPVYPDRALRGVFLTTEQPYFAFASYPERTSPLADVRFPDRIDRPFLLAHLQLAYGDFAPKPEEEIQLDWDPQYPDRVTRAVELPIEQPYFTTSPFPERTSPLATVVFPDRVERAFLTTANQFFVSEVIPKPEERIQLDWDPSYPDRALRGVFLTAEHPFFASNIAPDRTAPLADVRFPDRIDRPFLLTANQLAVTEISPRPEEEIQLDWDPIYPDRARREWLITANHLPFAFAPFPERTTPIAVTVFPDRVERAYLQIANHLAVTEIFPKPEEKVQLDWDPSYPDRALRAVFLTAEHPFFTTSPKAEERIQLDWDPSYPDRALRGAFLTAEHPFFTTSSKVEEVVQLDWDPIYPDRASRAWLPVADFQFFASNVAPERTTPLAVVVFPDRTDRAFLSTASQMASTEALKPEEEVQLDWDPIYPDRALRITVLPSHQPYFAFAPYPERTSPLASVVFPDRVERAFLTTANQFFVSEIPPRPDERIQLDWDPVYPDRALRAWFLTAEYPFFAANIAPERTSPLAVVVFPDRVEQAVLSTANQLAVTEISPFPERTSPLADVRYPDRVERAYIAVANQLAVTEVFPKPEEEIQLDWHPSYPDRALRGVFFTAEHPFFTSNVAPERTSPLAVVVFPDRIDRPFLLAENQLAVTEISPAPERTSPLADVRFPDRIDRPFLLPALQLAVTEISPFPERVSPLADVRFPDRIDRPFLLAHQQLAYGDFAPKPEEKIQLDWDPSYPDRATRAWFLTAEQQAFTTSPNPIIFVVGEQQFTYFPDMVLRAYIAVANQLAVTEISPAPERTQSIAVTVFPDRIDRAFLLAHNQLAVTEISPRPDERIQLDWDPVYPDRALKVWISTANQFAVTEVFPKPEERIQLDWDPQYPDRATRAWLLVGDQMFFAENIFPIAEVPRQPLVTYPDRVPRAEFFTAEHPFFTTSPKAEEEVQLDWDPVYPDRALRACLLAHNQLAVTEISPAPERTSRLADVRYPDRIDRPFLLAHNQLAVTEIPPRPEGRISLDWQPVYPDRALHEWLLASEQLAFATSYAAIFAPTLPLTYFPERVLRAFLPTSEYPAFVTSPSPIVFLTIFSTSVFIMDTFTKTTYPLDAKETVFVLKNGEIVTEALPNAQETVSTLDNVKAETEVLDSPSPIGKIRR